MNRKHTIIRAACVGMALLGTQAFAQLTGTTTLTLTVGPFASITINTASTPLASASTAPYTGTTSFTYFIRTSQTTGSGAIVLKITTDFSPTQGPSVATPPSAGDALTYTCTATVGTICSGTQTASTTATSNVVAFGADAHSVVAGSTGTVIWALTNDPIYKSGTYTATATFTISAT